MNLHDKKVERKKTIEVFKIEYELYTDCLPGGIRGGSRAPPLKPPLVPVQVSFPSRKTREIHPYTIKYFTKQFNLRIFDYQLTTGQS